MRSLFEATGQGWSGEPDRLHWDAPLNSYSAMPGQGGLYVWSEAGEWELVPGSEGFTPEDLDDFRVWLPVWARILRLL